MLVGENQKLNETNNLLLTQINSLQDEIYKQKDNTRVSSDFLRQHKTQLDDVMTMYRRVNEEKEKLAHMLESTSSEKLKLEGHLNNVVHDYENLKSEFHGIHSEKE